MSRPAKSERVKNLLFAAFNLARKLGMPVELPIDGVRVYVDPEPRSHRERPSRVRLKPGNLRTRGTKNGSSPI